MDIRASLRSFIDRKLTFVVIPQADGRPWRVQCTMGFLAFCLVAWGGLTVWAGFIAGRHVDYWITKADNEVMRTKLNTLAGEMDRSRDMLDLVRSTDRQLRSLLALSRRADVAEGEGVGGPTSADRMSLKAMLEGRAASLSQADWHKRIRDLRQETAQRLASFQEISWYISNQRSLYHATPSMWPTEGRLTSVFGYRFDPMRRRGADGEDGEFHQGLDIANTPDTLIYATADGTVRHADWSHGYGQMILIDHGYGVSTLYGHTSKALVKAGTRVSRGQVIAYMGTTGRSTGAHLHYEVWRHGKPVNPMVFLKVRAGGDLLSSRGPSTRAAGR